MLLDEYRSEIWDSLSVFLLFSSVSSSSAFGCLPYLLFFFFFLSFFAQQNKRSKDRRLGNHIPEAKNKDHSDGESDTMSLIHDSRSKFPHSRFNAPDVVSLSMDSGFPSPSILSTSQVLSATTNCPSVALSTISLRNSPASSVLDRPDVSLLETMSLQTSSSSSSFGFSQSSYSLSSILEGGSVHLPSIKDPLPLQKKNEGKELDSETEENEDAREECESGSEVFRVLPSFGDLVSSLPRKRASMVHSSLPKLPLSLFFPHPFVTASK